MALFKSGNPALKEETFTNIARVQDGDGVMTLQGTVNKTALLLLLVILPAMYVWNEFQTTSDFSSISIFFYTGVLGSLVVGIILAFQKKYAAYLAPAYAMLEGLAMGGLSAVMEAQYPGIVFQAVVLTFGIFAVLLLVYKLEIIKPSENFKLIVTAATGGVAVYYGISFLLSFVGIHMPLINDSGLAGIVFSIFVIIIASMNLVVDFDFIEQGAKNKVPKYMEWYGAFGLMVTLIWLYIEILRLLGKTRKK